MKSKGCIVSFAIFMLRLSMLSYRRWGSGQADECFWGLIRGQLDSDQGSAEGHRVLSKS